MTELVIVLGVFIWACLVLAAFACCVVGGNADANDAAVDGGTRNGTDARERLRHSRGHS
jgi:hypothetical protein